MVYINLRDEYEMVLSASLFISTKNTIAFTLQIDAQRQVWGDKSKKIKHELETTQTVEKIYFPCSLQSIVKITKMHHRF